MSAALQVVAEDLACRMCGAQAGGAANNTLTHPDMNKLFEQVRGATALDQKELLLWLKKKFEPKQH